MKYLAFVDLSSFIWSENDFKASPNKYYEVVQGMPELFNQLKINKSFVLLRQELFRQIQLEFPYKITEKKFYDFQKMTLTFLSKLGSKMIVYSNTSNINITSNPNLEKNYYSQTTNEEIRYLITRIHSETNPANILFTFKKLWNHDGDLSTCNQNISIKHKTIYSDDKKELEKLFLKYKNIFEHNPKHSKYKAGQYESHLSCYNDRKKDTTKAQKLLDEAFQYGNAFYNFDLKNNVMVVFRRHEGNKYHGFNHNNPETLPSDVRKKFSK